MGKGSSPQVVQAAPPPQPTVQGSMEDYVKNLPALYEAQLQYLPQFSQLAYDISQKLYPETTAAQENVASAANVGMGEDLPQWARDEYMDTLKSTIGPNVMSGKGADFMGRGMMNLKKNWKDYYTNLALTASGRQPLVNAGSGQSAQGGFSPTSTMGFNSANYGPYAGASASMSNNANNIGWQKQQWNQAQPFMWMQGAGNAMQGMGGQGKGFMGWS